MRTGTLARKLGMSRVFTDNGRAVPVTVLQVDNVQVVAVRRPERDGYSAVQLGGGTAKVRRVSRAMRGHYANAGVAPKQTTHEFRIPATHEFELGTEVGAHHFAIGQFVDVHGVAKGKGFAGVMKRYGFSGLRASHGVSVSHRSQGSTGQCQDPGRVFKGKKMAGHLGDHNVTVQNLEVVRIDPARGILMVRGAVPGAKNSWVAVQDAVKKPAPELPAVPEPYVPPAESQPSEVAAPADTETTDGAAVAAAATEVEPTASAPEAPTPDAAEATPASETPTEASSAEAAEPEVTSEPAVAGEVAVPPAPVAPEAAPPETDAGTEAVEASALPKTASVDAEPEAVSESTSTAEPPVAEVEPTEPAATEPKVPESESTADKDDAEDGLLGRFKSIFGTKK